MSRTDGTDPLWVRHLRHDPRPLHDHRAGGDCDLPPRPARAPSGTRCRWEHPETLLFRRGCCSGCHRRGCTREWQLLRKVSNRRERYEGRRIARDQLRTADRGER
ncbi:hypothetical protein MTQ01_14170 [Streptomyces sp. XM4193]|uniref:hypothetical protein n=1 Tax=Streptomyces sp. XM4193 TaxID=2929782 RepID=UPI001FFA6698|nr:hypothetical protein [Streptomyces sp. XM4193]MCK1797144.1 hypothetical protein [Streptomyces sp. XM4193]